MKGTAIYTRERLRFDDRSRRCSVNRPTISIVFLHRIPPLYIHRWHRNYLMAVIYTVIMNVSYILLFGVSLCVKFAQYIFYININILLKITIVSKI